MYLNSMVDLKFEINETDPNERGSFKGVAYSGKPIEWHGPWQNLITDIDSLTFKSEIPVFRNHDSEQIVGKASLYKENGQLLVKGRLFKKSKLSAEIMDFAAEGFAWELSIGMSLSELEFYDENSEVEANGQVIKGPAHLIRNAKVNEVSFVPIGADASAYATVFEKDLIVKTIGVKKMEIKKVEFNEQEWIDFACGCGGSAESSLDDLKSEVKKLKDENEKLKSKLDKYSEKEKSEKVEKAIADHGLVLTDEKKQELLSDEAKFEMFISTLEFMPKAKPTIDPKFAPVVIVEPTQEEKTSEEKRVARIAKAKQLVADKKAMNFKQAIAMLPDDEY